ncbi:unnamed protein product [Clonostachys solani]|uniref:Carboxymuconolactone decarboxylase-like domain-containing protein n=1 Tax=Clonostachys solani TaxID=160281 RepID=A0A9P0EGG1_9HYPO|nr:unnamed protein product [Clonostachys solani]
MDHSGERFPPIHPDDLNPDQREIHDGIFKILPGGNSSFKFKDDDTDALIGPLPCVLTTPVIGRAWQAGLGALSQTAKAANPPLNAECREIAILTVGARFQAAFMLYSHDYVSRTETTFTREQIKKLMVGRRPEGLDEKGNITMDVVKYLIYEPGPLPDYLYKKAVEILGKEATVALIHYAGYYCYVSCILNGADIPIPEPLEF